MSVHMEHEWLAAATSGLVADLGKMGSFGPLYAPAIDHALVAAYKRGLKAARDAIFGCRDSAAEADDVREEWGVLNCIHTIDRMMGES